MDAFIPDCDCKTDISEEPVDAPADSHGWRVDKRMTFAPFMTMAGSLVSLAVVVKSTPMWISTPEKLS